MKTHRNVIPICLLVAALLALPIAGQAQFIYTTNNGMITITQYTGSGGDVVIPNTVGTLPVTTVGSSTFYQVSGLTSVTFGTNVTTIAPNAIFQCPGITGVSIPASVTNIGMGPVIDCKSLTTISVSSTNLYYTNVNNVLFNTSLKSLIEFPGGVGGSYTIPATVTNTGQAFIGNSLTTITVNPANTLYTNQAGVLFNKNRTQLISYPGAALDGYTVPTNVTTIVSASFEYSTGVTNVIIGTNVTSIGQFAFYDCSSLQAISVNATNAYYSSTNGVLFNKNKTQLIQYPLAVGGNYLVPGTVQDIGAGAFGGAIGLTGVVIPNSVTNIEQQAFYSCVDLAAVSLGDGLKIVGASAFFFCPSLDNLTFSASLTTLGQYSFGGCENLSSVCFAGNPPTDGGSVFYSDQSLSTILVLKGTTGWGSTYDGIPTAPCASCGNSVPQLGIFLSGKNVVLTWSTVFSGFSLQSATSLAPPVAWSMVSPAPAVFNGYYAVTNLIATPVKFYRLSQ
jgi:hypothetical protein